MPVPTHVFDPPFNIIRCSHAVLDVTDLDASRAFYETTVGLHVEDARRQGGLPARQRGASASLAGAAQGGGRRLQPARLQGRQRRRSRQGRRVLLRRTASPTPSPNSRSRAARCSSPTPSASSSSSTPRWRSARICCGATTSTRAAIRSGSTISTSSPPRCRTPSISTPGSASASPNMPRRTARTDASPRPGCTARATCTISPSPTAGALACTTSPIGCRPR